MCTKTPDTWMLSYSNLHEMSGRATPNRLMDYKLALQLYRTYNDEIPTQDWISLNLNSILHSRQTKFSVNTTNRYKVGMNILSNRLSHLNGKIDLNWLNSSYNTYKKHCKDRFLNLIFHRFVMFQL